MTREQLSSLRAQISGDRYEVLYLLALATGMRQGEILALRRSDLDLDRMQLQIEHTLEPVAGGGFRLSPTKTERSRRTLPLPPRIVEMLREHLARMDEEKRPAWAEGELVFSTKTRKSTRRDQRDPILSAASQGRRTPTHALPRSPGMPALRSYFSRGSASGSSWRF